MAAGRADCSRKSSNCLSSRIGFERISTRGLIHLLASAQSNGERQSGKGIFAANGFLEIAPVIGGQQAIVVAEEDETGNRNGRGRPFVVGSGGVKKLETLVKDGPRRLLLHGRLQQTIERSRRRRRDRRR